jgi:iron(III) transport system substrate-binding protein
MTDRKDEHESEESDADVPTGRAIRSRRKFLQLTGSAVGAAALAGCSGEGASNTQTSTGTTATATATNTATTTATDTATTTNTTTEQPTETQTQTPVEPENIDDWRGDGPLIDDRPDQYESGVSIQSLPDLSGDLTVYLGGGEGGLYQNLMDRLQEVYDGFSVDVRLAESSQLANTILEESSANQSPADVFWSIDAGSIGVVASQGATLPLPDRVTAEVPDTFAPTNNWIGIMGRARCITYNTETLNANQIPQDVFQFAQQPQFSDAMGWAPTYGAFQAFVTSMRLLNSDQRARSWLNGMQEQGIETYDNELLVANAVAEGELAAGFTNHYYSRLVFEERPDAPIELAFTRADAGSLVNCSGMEVIQGTQNRELAANFIHHMLSIEAQEYLCTNGYEYPLVPSVPPVGDLPTIDQLNPPNFNLARLSNLEPTLRLLRETGAL